MSRLLRIKSVIRSVQELSDGSWAIRVQYGHPFNLREARYMLDMWLIVNVDNLAEIPPKIGDVVEVDVPQVIKHWPAEKESVQ